MRISTLLQPSLSLSILAGFLLTACGKLPRVLPIIAMVYTVATT